MARVLLYERVVDAVFIHANPSCDTEIQDGMKIKDEPIDTPLNIDTRNVLSRNFSNLKNDTSNRNCLNPINHNEASLLENDIAPKTIKNKNSKRVSNSHSAYVGDAAKTFNLKRKRTPVKTEQVRNALSQSNKKQKRSNDFQISKNKNINSFTKTTKKINTRRKQQSIISVSRTKKQRTTQRKKTATECNICFRTFSSFRNCETHKQCYIGNYQCKNCKMHYMTHKKYYFHTLKCYKETECYNVNCRSKVYCNFCHRGFKKIVLLQSHLFHLHRELIYSSNITKRKNPKCKSENILLKNDILKTDAHEELLCPSNLMKSKKETISLINHKSSSDDDAMKIGNLGTEESFNDGMSPTKKLRQPTLTEYLELCKRKRDINASPNKFNIIKDGFSSALFYKRVNNSKSNFSEICTEQIDSLPTKSSNLEQMAHSTLEKDRNHEVSKKPFVKLHADVEMMKSFLEKLPNIIEDKITKDQRNDIVSCYQEMPYSLRSPRAISSAKSISSLRKRKSEDASKKFQFNTECSTKTEHNMVNLNKIDSNFWKTIMIRFKCKDCRIILTRCDEKIREDNRHQNFAIEPTFKENFSPQCNSILFQENNIRNEIVLKKLEVSLERLTTVPAVDITKMKTVSDIEKHNDGSFLCKVCKKSFSSKLDKHMHIKSSHIAYMSSICDARYKLKHKLLQHYLSEHLSKQNQCCVCYNVLSNYVELKRHLNVHCLKYVQKENDRCPIDIEVKCSSIKNNYKCLQCSTAFLTQTSLMIHQSVCILQEEMTTDQKDSMKKINACPKIILKVQRSNNANGLTVIRDEKTHSDDECLSKNSVEMINEHCISLISEEDPKIIKELKINENKQNSSVDNNLITKEIGIINESQNSEKLLENSNSTISNQDIANAQLDAIKSKINIYPCDICGKQFHSPKNLQQHIRSFNYTTDVCPICGTAFSSKRLLQSHITAAHVPQISKTYNFHCVFCNQGFIKKHELRPHILHLHNQQILDTFTHDFRPNEEILDTQTAMCNVCNLVFETHDRYMQHKMYYYKNHTFTCSLCAQDFQGMYMLNHHTKLTHYSEDKRKSYNYICNICNEGFNHEKHFHSHNMHVHSNKENLTEIAEESEERSRFDHASEDQEHIRNCSTSKQKEIEQFPDEYTCQICQLKCRNIDDMAKHIAFYSNNGDFKCDRCKRQCKTFDLLYQHKKLTHTCRDIYNGHACHICGEVLETVISLNCHKKHFHSNDIVCDNALDRKNCEQTLSSNTASKLIEHQLKSNNAQNTTKWRYNCLFCDMRFLSANAIQTHILQTHIDDLAAKNIALRPSLFTIEDDNIRKHSIQQFIEANQASISVVTPLSTSASIVTTTSATTKTSTIASTTLTSATAITTSASVTGALVSTSTAITTISTSKAVAATLEDTSTQFLQDKIPNILDKKEIKDKTNIDSNQIKAILLKDNIIAQKISAMPSISGFRTDIASSMAFALSHEFNGKVIVPLSTLKSANAFQASVIQSTVPLHQTLVLVPQVWKNNETTNQKSEQIQSYNHNSNYMCPLCPLEYPSLMFFHAHLRYAHADSIQTDIINSQLNQSTQDFLIKCLLCLCVFTDEDKYKNHLKNSHTDNVYMNSKNEEKTDEKKKSTTPEIITVDDDDDDDVENSLNQRTVETTAILAHEEQNEKIGKLRVKPFAKIMENLSMEYGLKHL